MIPSPFHRKARVVLGIASQFFCCSEDDLRGRSRKHPIIWYRHIVMTWLLNNTNASSTQIARYFGGLDHTTVLNARKNVIAWMDTGDELGDSYRQLEELCDRFLQAEEHEMRPDLERVSVSIGQAFLSGLVIDLDPIRCSCSAKVDGDVISQEVSHA